MKDTSFPTQLRHPEPMPPWTVLWLQNNRSIKPIQPNSPTRPMGPCTLTDLFAPGTCIPTSADIRLERESFLSKGDVPEEGSDRRECNNVREAIAGPSTMNLAVSTQAYSHYWCDCYGDMMSYDGLQGVNLKPCKNFISQKYKLS